MNSKDTAITIEGLSKCYRIGLKENIHDSFAGAIFDFIKSPLTNYRKYRSLYNFDDVKKSSDSDSVANRSDIIWALKDITFDAKRGEVLGIIGRNGAGKSTLLKILSKITDPTRGRAEIHGRISSLLEVGTGFHQELTGRENVYLNGTVLGMTKKEVDSKFDEIVDFSGVEKFLDTPVKRYSSGMKVRLAFAVAAHLEPEILIIDEVLAVGDARFQRKCLNKMQDIGKEGRTVLFVSHNIPAVTRLCDKAILLDQGKLIKYGLSHEVVATYFSNGSGTAAEAVWSETSKAPGGEIARLRAVRVRTQDNLIAEKVDIRWPVGIEMEYEVLKPGYLLLPHYYFFNEQGIKIFTSMDNDASFRRAPRPTGRYKSCAWIPGNFLSEGMVFVSAVLITLEPVIGQFYEPDIIAFQVVDNHEGDTARGDWTGPITGVVRPLLKWTTNSSPVDKKLR